MNTPLPPDHDKSHDELPDEARLAALYRKLPKSEPSPMLDAAVLRAAAEAIAAEPSRSATPAIHAQTRKPRMRWLIPLSSAATLMLAAGLAWHMRDMPVAGSTTVDHASVATTPDAETVTPPSAAAPPATTNGPASAPPPPPAQDMAVAERPNAVVIGSQPAPRSRPPDSNRRVAMVPAEKVEKKASDKEAAADAPASFVESNLAPQEYVSTKTAPTPATATEPSRDAAVAGVVATRDEAEAPVVAQATMAAPAPMLEAEPQPAAPPVASMPAVRASADTTRNAADTPAQELAKIRLLFESHHGDEGTTRLIVFHRKYPDMRLPADLRTRLPDHP